jgi:chromosome segregation ATPase
MRSTKKTKQSNAAAARAARAAQNSIEPTANQIASTQDEVQAIKVELDVAKARILELEAKLAQEEAYSHSLLEKLDSAEKSIDELVDKLNDLENRCSDHYCQLQVERRACQQGLAQKGVLEGQVKLLQAANIKSNKEHQDEMSDANWAINALLSENLRLALSVHLMKLLSSRSTLTGLSQS